MRIILRVYDFIKSWRYYPIMEKYLQERLSSKCPYSRLKYGLWHYKDCFLPDAGIENNHTDFKRVRGSWESVYQREPIEK